MAVSPQTSRVSDLADPARHAYLTQIADLMDDRTRRLGQHAAQTTPAWAVNAVGPVPTDPAARRHWEDRAAPIAAYREMYGYDHPGDPIGPEPTHQSPGQRAAWYAAFAALNPADSPDVRTMPDGRLWLFRDTYAAETAWAPPHTGKELRQARLAAFDTALGAIRAAAEAQTARKVGDYERAGRHETLAASYLALRDHYQQREQTLAQAMADRRKWERATADGRHLAIAADAELRRRYPEQKIEPLRSAEPVFISATEREHLDPGSDWRFMELASWMRESAAQLQAFRARLDERQRLTLSCQDLDWARLGDTLSALWEPHRDAILQPPKPQITPSAKILQLFSEHVVEPEAAG